MAKVRLNRNINITRVVKKISYTVLGLYVGGFFITILGSVMNGTCSPFYQGVRLIGWSVGNVTGTQAYCSTIGAADPNTIYATSGTSILSVIGLIGISSVVLEFVSFSW